MQSTSVYEITWNKSNFQSLNKSFKNYNLFANPFIARDNLNSFRFKTWLFGSKIVNFCNAVPSMKLDEVFQSFKATIDCLNSSICLLTDSIYERIWIILKTRSPIMLLKLSIFSRIHSMFESTWSTSGSKRD